MNVLVIGWRQNVSGGMVPTDADLNTQIRNRKRVKGRVVEDCAWENNTFPAAFDLAAHLTVDLRVFAELWADTRLRVSMDICSPAYQTAFGEVTGSDDGIVAYESIAVTNSRARNEAMPLGYGLVFHNGLLRDKSVLNGNGVIEQPTGSLLGEVVLALHIPAELALLNVAAKGIQGADSCSVP